MKTVIKSKEAVQSHLNIHITYIPRMFLKFLNSSRNSPEKKTTTDNSTPVIQYVYMCVSINACVYIHIYI